MTDADRMNLLLAAGFTADEIQAARLRRDLGAEIGRIQNLRRDVAAFRDSIDAFRCRMLERAMDE